MGVWGFNFVALKLVLLQMTAPASALVRGLLMYAALLVICVATGKSLRYPPGTFWRISLQGFLAMGLYMVLFVTGMKDSTATEGAIILGCAPVFTLLIACLAGQERFRMSILAGTLLAFGGVAIVVMTSPSVQINGARPIAGNLLLLCSALVWAAVAVVSRPIVKEVEPLRLLTLSMPAGILTLLPFGGMDLVRMDWSALNLTTWSMMAYFAFAAGTLGFILFYRGVSQVGAAGAMLYQYLVSPLAAISGLLVLHSPIVPFQIVGMVVVLTGVTLANMARQRNELGAVPVE